MPQAGRLRGFHQLSRSTLFDHLSCIHILQPIGSFDRKARFVGMMQPLNAAVFVTDGVFVGAGKFGNIAIANTVGATLGIVSMFVFVSLELMLLGIWLGILIFMATRAAILRRQFWKWARAC